MQPQPIDTAPRDGTPILTDRGTVCWLNEPDWGEAPGWFHCDSSGDAMACIDYGQFRTVPTVWTPLPDWMKPARD